MKLSVNSLKPGQVYEENGNAYAVLNVQNNSSVGTIIVQGMNLITKETIEKSYDQRTSVHAAALTFVDMDFQYSDGTQACLMNPKTYEEVMVPEKDLFESVGECEYGTPCEVIFFKDKVVGVQAKL